MTEDIESKEALGEVISGAVSSSIQLKLRTDSEEVKIGFPAVIEGKKYDFFSIISDIQFPTSNAVTMLANAEKLRNTIPMSTIDTSRGRTFYSIAELQCVQMIDRSTLKTLEFETLPPYFSMGRLANKMDVQRVYQTDLPEYTESVGTMRGIEGFEIPIDFKKLVEVPFGIYGRTHSGKTFLNKIILGNIIKTDVSQVLVFDMQSEYGWRSRADNSPGLKFFFENQVTLLSLDPSTSTQPDDALLIGENEIEPGDLIVAFDDLTSTMIDIIYEIDRRRGKSQSLIDAINATAELEELPSRINRNSLNALTRKISRLENLSFVVRSDEGNLNEIMKYIQSGQNIVIDFGKFGANPLAYIFVANIISRRLYTKYSQMVDMSELPRLVVLLEEAHKFLDPKISHLTIFDKLAREMRKFNLVLAMVDQRPSKIDTEILSQLANRFILSLTDPKDIINALTGPVDPAAWRAIVRAMPPRTVLMFGDAIRAPTAMDVLEYNENTMMQKWHIGTTTEEIRDSLDSLSDEEKDNMFE